VRFDVWFSEKGLYDNGQYEKAISILRDMGHVVEREGAVWFASSELGEDKDNVLVRTTRCPPTLPRTWPTTTTSSWSATSTA